MVLERRDPTQPPLTQQRMQTEADTRSAADLLRELSNEATNLVRQEIALAKLEMSEKLARMARNIALIAIGAVVAYAGLLALVQTAINGLGVGLWQGLPLYIAAWLAPLIIGLLVLGVGGFMAWRGYSNLKKQNITPNKTLQTMRENKQWLENQIR